MPTNNLGQSDIATHQTNIWNKVSSTAKRIFHYKGTKKSSICRVACEEGWSLPE